MGLINCALAPLEPERWTRWNTPDDIIRAKIGPGEVTRAVPWSTLTPEQKRFQRTKMAIHAAMISRMDAEIGKVLKQVQTMGAEQNTVVIFLSDNGASPEQLIRGDGHDGTAAPGSARTHLGVGPGWSSCANTPFRLHKSWVHEGGISSPMIVNWPAGLRDTKKIRHNPGHFVDVLPTLLELAGDRPDQIPAAEAPLRPGLSFASLLRKAGRVKGPPLYFSHNSNRAIRIRDWKLVSIGENGPWELYDLGRDRCEQKDQASKQPARVTTMAALWKEHDDRFVRQRETATETTKERMKPLA
ncbi:MAG: sulfatase-like hydrolase/transferase [Bryobacteraceae bacterium]